jgi:hypothetical protein
MINKPEGLVSNPVYDFQRLSSRPVCTVSFLRDTENIINQFNPF